MEQCGWAFLFVSFSDYSRLYAAAAAEVDAPGGRFVIKCWTNVKKSLKKDFCLVYLVVLHKRKAKAVCVTVILSDFPFIKSNIQFLIERSGLVHVRLMSYFFLRFAPMFKYSLKTNIQRLLWCIL